jgi:hypothetical protein
MLYRLLSDGIVGFHFVFIVFAMFGAALVAWKRAFIWLHAPALGWGLWIELSHGVCPLTPLENHFRALAGEAGYSGGFIEHYLLPVIYPHGLRAQDQLVLAAVLLLLNLSLYGLVLLRWRRIAPGGQVL